MMAKYDLCLCAIPYIEYHLPPAAPALLKGHLESKGYRILTKDLNINFKARLQNQDNIYTLIEYWYDDFLVSNPDKKSALSDDLQAEYDCILQNIANELISTDSSWIGLSVFSQDSRKFCRDIARSIKTINSKIKILVGGQGLNSYFLSTINQYIDAYILGEGEIALEELLKGNMTYPGINSPGKQLENLDFIGFPDYSQYELSLYEHFYDSPAIQITGSRGCIKNCSFCNVADIWEKYKYRSGELISEEIIHIYEKHGIRHFFFTDSLINGNVKQLMAMTSKLADYKSKTGAKITWGGQWITRSQKGLPKDYYELISQSGAFNLTVGVETGSDRVRADMKKGFTNADLDSELEQFSKHGITCGFLMLLGYPTETFKDFEQTLEMFQRYVKYVADGTIIGVALGEGFLSLEGTPVLKELGQTWTYINNDPRTWKSLVTNSNYIENIRRRIIAQIVIDNLKWPTNNTIYELGHVMVRLKEISQTNTNIDFLDIDQKYFEQKYLLVDNDITDIELELEPTKGMSWPTVEVLVNKQVKVSETIDQIKKINFSCSVAARNILKINLLNKTAKDTLLDQQGNFVFDKSVKINYIKINGVRVRPDQLYLKGRFKNLNGKKYKCGGLYENGSWSFYFPKNSTTYFIEQQEFYYKKNSYLNKQRLQELADYYQKLNK